MWIWPWSQTVSQNLFSSSPLLGFVPAGLGPGWRLHPGPSPMTLTLLKTGVAEWRNSDFRSVQFDDVLIGFWGSISGWKRWPGLHAFSECCTRGLLRLVVRSLGGFCVFGLLHQIVTGVLLVISNL